MGALGLFKADDSKLSSALAWLNGHDAIILNLRLQVPIGRWLLPESIRFRTARLFHDLSKSRRLHVQQFHREKSPPENYGKEGQTTVAAFLPWRGS